MYIELLIFTGTDKEKKKQMKFRSICFQVIETEQFKILCVVILRLFMTSLSVGCHC